MSSASVLQSMTGRLILWFVENPDEELTTADVQVKFCRAPTRSMRSCLQEAVDMGLIVRSGRGRGHSITYAAGPEIKRLVLAGAARLQPVAVGHGAGA